MNDLQVSYYNTIKDMDLNIISPFMEVDLIPFFKKSWLKYLLAIYSIESNKFYEIRNLFLNIPVIRSMLIMDLFYLHFLNLRNHKNICKNFYINLLSYYYDEDIFSLKNNRHKFLNYRVLNDYTFFELKDSNIISYLLGLCYSYSYLRNTDCLADNTYEILGLYTIKHYDYIIHKFNNVLGKDIMFIQFSGNHRRYGDKLAGKIDLFGHNTYFISNRFSLCIEDKPITDYTYINNLIYSLEMENSKFKNSYTTEISKITLFLNRYFERYENILNYLNIPVPDFLNMFDWEAYSRLGLKYKFRDKNLLKKIIK